MKAKFLCVAMAAAALASCSKNEVVEMPENRAITFGETFVGNSTRADYGSKNLPTSFKVWGQYDKDGEKVNIFKEEVITKGSDGKYAQAEDATIHYWIPNKNYTFAAIVTGKTPAFNFTDAGKLTFENYTVNALNQEDLLYATVERTNNTDYTAVKFDFGHLLSKVNFTYQATSLDDAYTMTVSEVKFYGMNSKGNFEGENWNATTTEAVAQESAFAMDGKTTTGQTVTEATNFVYILPQTAPEGTTLSLKAVITDEEGTEVKTINGTVTLKDQAWAKSNTYTYNIKINPELNQITFDTPTVGEFTKGQADDQDATNQPGA